MGNEGVVAVERALSLLDCFRLGKERYSLTELADVSGMHKTTVYRLMNSLEKMEYVVRSQSGTYTLGHRLLFLGKLYEQSFHLSSVVEPALHDLVALTKESASYYVHDQGRRLCLFRVEPEEGLRETRLAGTSLPLDDASASRVIRRWGLHEAASNAPSAPALFTSGMRDPHTASFAAPVFGADNQFMAALSLSGPASRLNLAHASGELMAPLTGAAKDLSRRLGASVRFCDDLYGV